MDYKKEIQIIIQDLRKQIDNTDKKRDKEEDNDSFFFLSGKRRGLKITLIKLHNLINKK